MRTELTMPHIHIAQSFNKASRALLCEKLDPRLTVTFGETVDAAADILVCGRPSRAQLSSPALKSLIIPWAGLPDATKALLKDTPDLSVHNIHHNAGLVAEMALNLLLSAAKLTLRYDRALRRNDWRLRYQPNPSLTLEGRTALVLGYGAIGQRIARACDSLGMSVKATRHRATESYRDTFAEVYPAARTRELLSAAQVLIVCLPHTELTDNLLGEEELDLLPEQSIVVNVGRAAIINEAALFKALSSGHLHSAGLDVWYQYPETEEQYPNTPPSQFPFHQLDNVVMSPHRAGHSVDTDGLRMTHLAKLLNHAAEGSAELPNALDLQLGY